MIRFLLLAAFVFFGVLSAPTAHAAPPKPGSVGYLYESCANMLEAGTNLPDIYRTYCASFLEGYLAGASVSNGINLPPAISAGPCADDFEKAYNHINARVCTHIPDYRDGKTKPAEMITTAREIVARWLAFEGKSDPAFLDRRASETIGDLIQPGAFCNSLEGAPPSDLALPPINPKLLDIGWQSYLKIQEDVTLKRKYIQCKADLKRWEDDPKFSFDVSWCGGEIDGYLAGLRATDKLQSSMPEFTKQCAKPIERLYRTLDVQSSMCLKDGIKPLDIARIFVRRYEQGIEKDAGFANLKALGAVGYETVYRGFLCLAPDAGLSPMP